MNIRSDIWATFCNMKFKGFILSLLVSRYQKMDRNLNIFLAIASSGSIAVWAIWKELPLFWSSIIAISQVVTVIKPHFPYSKMIKELNSRCYKMDLLNIELERFWRRFEIETIPTDLAMKILYDQKRSYAEILNFPDDLVFETPTKIENAANGKMRTYLKLQFGVII